MGRYVAWAAIAVLSALLVLVLGSWFGIYSPLLRGMSVAFAASALAVWALVAWRRPSWRPDSALTAGIALALGALSLSSLQAGSLRIGAEYLAYAIVLATLYLLLVRILADAFLRRRIGSLTVALSVMIGALFVGVVVRDWVELWDLVGRIVQPPLRPKSESLTYGNPSTVLAVYVLLGSAAVAHVGWMSRSRAALSIGIVALGGVVALLSGSRAGWLAIAVAMAATTALALWRGRASLRRAFDRLRLRPLSRPFMAGAAILALGVASTAVLGPAILARVTSGGEDLRANYLVASLRMFADSPILGLGPGSWAALRRVYTVEPEADYLIPHAHNVYAQTAAELGILGVIAGLVVALFVVRLIRDGLADAQADRRRWAWLALFSTIYLAAHQGLDLFMNMPAVLAAAVIPIAWLDATRDPARDLVPLGPRVRRLLTGAGSLGLVVALVGLLIMEQAAAHHAGAVAKANDGLWAAAVEDAGAAVEADPDIPAYGFTLGLVLNRLGDTERAADLFRGSAAADDLPEGWLNLAAEESALGRPANALDAIRASLRLGIQRPAIAMAAGELARELGDARLARSSFSSALALVPSLAGDPWWHRNPERAAAFDLALADAKASVPAVAWEIALMAGLPDEARELAADAPNPILAEEIVNAWTGEPGGAEVVYARCVVSPLDATAVSWCSRVAGHAGDSAQRERFQRWGFIVGASPLGAGELRVSDAPLIGRSVEGNVALFYGTYTYRRPTPWDLLVPSLVHLTLL